MTIELVSYDDLKSLLGLTEVAIINYPALGLIRTSVTSAIEEELDRLFEPIERTETIYIGQFLQSMIPLPAIPISAVDSVIITIGTDSESYTEDEDYEVTDYGLRLFNPLSRAKIVVVYTGGLTEVPDAIARAALLQTAYEFQSKDQVGATSMSTDGGSVSRPELGLLKEVKRLLKNYKHPLLGV